MRELNDTGSFPDESEKTPMCFVKCILEGAGVLTSNNDINKVKAIALYQLDNEDLVDDCVIEMGEYRVQYSFMLLSASILAAAKQGDTCLRSYYFVRCLMARSLLENLGEDNDSNN
jgi:PBP/GOBP family